MIYGAEYDKDVADTNVQFMRYLEKICGCDLVEPIKGDDFVNSIKGMRPCVNTSQKEIFQLLDKCHIIPNEKDAIFDFGCGNGTALISFLDYGLSKVGGENMQIMCTIFYAQILINWGKNM